MVSHQAVGGRSSVLQLHAYFDNICTVTMVYQVTMSTLATITPIGLVKRVAKPTPKPLVRSSGTRDGMGIRLICVGSNQREFLMSNEP